MITFGYDHYVPILKGKRGEFVALLELDNSIKNSITPLIEVPPIPWDFEADVAAKDIEKHLSTFIPNIERYWGDANPVFIDMNLIPDKKMNNGEHPLTNIFNQARGKNLQVIPVTGIGRDQEYQNAIKEVVQKDNRGLCIRIDTADIDNDDKFDQSLSEFIANLNVKKSQIHLIIDLKEIQNSQIGLLVRSIRDLIRSLPSPNEWATLTLCATAFPQTMSGFEPNSVSVTSRVEWQLWIALFHNASRIPRMPTFGDYTVVHPELLEIDPRIMQLGAKIKYTFDNDWIIVKGTSIKRGGSDQTRDLCVQLTGLPEYRGSAYSYGDRYIDGCAKGNEGVGNQTTWVTVAVNHHITFVVNQLSSYLASSAIPSS